MNQHPPPISDERALLLRIAVAAERVGNLLDDLLVEMKLANASREANRQFARASREVDK